MASPSEQIHGMGIGSLFLSLFGGLWMVVALNAQPFIWLACCALLPTSLLLLRAIGVLHLSSRLREGEPPLSSLDRQESRQRDHGFGLIVMVEFVLIAVTANLLSVYHHPDWIIPAISLVVGAHFLPLARLFGRPLYYWTGGIELVLCGALAWTLRGRIEASIPFIGLVMGLSLWTTVLIVLIQAQWMARAAAAAQ